MSAPTHPVKEVARQALFALGQSLVEPGIDFHEEWWFARDRLAEFRRSRAVVDQLLRRPHLSAWRAGHWRPRSDTVFILASGPSVADLTPTQLAQIRAHDSIGINFWMQHDLVPTHYCLEPSTIPAMTNALVDGLCRRDDYRDVRCVVNGRLWATFEVAQGWLDPLAGRDLALCCPLHFPTISRRLFAAQCWAWRHLPRARRHILPIHHRSNLSLAICLAMLSGWRNIVLVGVDLNRTGYFWDVGDRWTAPDGLVDSSRQLHATADRRPTRTWHSLPIQDVLCLFYRHLLRPAGCRLWIADRRSLLADRFPIWRPFTRDGAAGHRGRRPHRPRRHGPTAAPPR